MSARSYSGAHPYRPQCVIEAIVTEWAADVLDRDDWPAPTQPQ